MVIIGCEALGQRHLQALLRLKFHRLYGALIRLKEHYQWPQKVFGAEKHGPYCLSLRRNSRTSLGLYEGAMRLV